MRTEDGFRYARSIADFAPPRLRSVLARASRPGIISFALGQPAEDLLPARDLAEAQARVLPAVPAALRYAMPHEPLKRQIVDLMAARGVICSTEQVFLTSGAQQGIDLLARLFLDPGAEVVVEETVYEGFQLALLRLRGGRQPPRPSLPPPLLHRLPTRPDRRRHPPPRTMRGKGAPHPCLKPCGAPHMTRGRR